MVIGKKRIIESVPLNSNLKESILQTDNINIHQKDGDSLDLLFDIFKNRLQDHEERKGLPYTCYIEQKALSAFLKFADDVYKERRHEAQGVFVGYYFHDENSPQTEFVVCTNFLQASGKTTSITCEMSTGDLSKYSEYCDKHHMLIIAHVHSHPGLSAFYSMPDSETLRTLFYANQNIGIVIDNLQNQYLAYKIYDGERREEPIFVFNTDECINSGKLVTTLISNVSHGSNFHIREVIDFSKLRSPMPPISQDQENNKDEGFINEEKKNTNESLKSKNIRHIDIRIKSVERKLEQYKDSFETTLQSLPQDLITHLLNNGFITSKETIEAINSLKDDLEILNHSKNNSSSHSKFLAMIRKTHFVFIQIVPYVLLILLIGVLIVLLKSKTA